MKVKINQVLLGINGEELPNLSKQSSTILKDGVKTKTKSPSLTLKDVIVVSLLNPIQGETSEDKWRKYEIYKKVKDTKSEVILDIKDLALVKKCIGVIQPTLIMGQCFELLEGQ